MEIAKLLGWTRRHADGDREIMNDTAAACSAAYALIEGGHMAREDFVKLSVGDALPGSTR
jgi:hypothetical protein